MSKKGKMLYTVAGWDKLERNKNERGKHSYYDPEKKFTLTDTGLAEEAEDKQSVGIFAPPEKNSRKATRTYLELDRPITAKMKTLIESGECSGPFPAAGYFVDEAAGSGNSESKQRRLERSYSTIYGKN